MLVRLRLLATRVPGVLWLFAAIGLLAAVSTWTVAPLLSPVRKPDATPLLDAAKEQVPASHPKVDDQLRSPEAQAQDLVLGPPYVILDAATFQHGLQEIQLAGIEGPHRDAVCKDQEGLRWACGLRARVSLHNLLMKARLRCRIIDTAMTRRVRAFCTCDGEDVGSALIRYGWARPGSSAYSVELAQAQRNRAGLWNGDWSVEPLPSTSERPNRPPHLQ
jgi:endonuclease YncB( thermonuclease family)